MNPITTILLQSPAPAGGGIMQLVFLIAVIVVIIAVISFVKRKQNSELETILPVDQKNGITNASLANKVVNVTVTGGIIGLFVSSPQNSLSGRIKMENANGWRVIQVIPAESGNIFLAIYKLLILIVTLFLYSPANGFYVIMERSKNENLP